MRALTVVPHTANSLHLSDVPEPASDAPEPARDDQVLVDVVGVGICGTDIEIIAGEYGEAPPGAERLVLGHESLGRVAEAAAGSGLEPGDLVVAIVRCPDPVPCENCAASQWDMCRNGRYTEHGIKGADGFMRERYRAAPDRLVRLDASLGLRGVLLEPTSIVAKAWDLVDHAAKRSAYRPRTALVTGAGPVGLLAALLGVQRGLEVHVLDQVTTGPKPDLVRDLGATYHSDGMDDLGLTPDVVVECTGAAQLVIAALTGTGIDGITCLTGVSTPGRRRCVDLGGLNRAMVLENDVVLGSVNANRTHYEAAARALADADPSWLDRLLTRRVPLAEYATAFDRGPDDVKVVLQVAALEGGGA
ncbi:MAG TPA: glucose 1-dehydrogenase [Dermatophilaceae bacterium]|nr:glucose 1-dehydrogenase [Dermatophilaceae bacterium]